MFDSVVGVGHRVSGSLNNLHDKEMFLIIPGRNRKILKILTFLQKAFRCNEDFVLDLEQNWGKPLIFQT